MFKATSVNCYRYVVCAAMVLPALLVTQQLYAAEGKLLATAGLTQVEGSGGGGLVPWATLSGYDSREETSANVFATQVDVDDYRLYSWGAGISLYDRVELSAAKHIFDLTSLGGEIRQDVFGVKVRLYGDVVYSRWPQLSAGVQYKRLHDGEIAKAVGARNNDHGSDYYIAMTKVHLGLLAGYNVVWNITARATKANQLGLLGFGSEDDNDYETMLEGSLGVLLSRRFAFGFEYRQKPDKLAIREDDWRDLFITYIPNKAFNLTLAWADLGEIAGAKDQTGLYVSATGYLW